ncbi:MAG TPA: hypothetical protein VMZ28_14575 [Kofleriaceae bacterium]|nr:hypothetical protein [Kofleriaceae bacterium]
MARKWRKLHRPGDNPPARPGGPGGQTIDAELVQVARNLRLRARGVIGVLVAGRRLDIAPAALRLSVALSQLTGEPVVWFGDGHPADVPAGAGRVAVNPITANMAFSLRSARPRYPYVLFDLGRLVRDGALESVMGEVDGVLLAARAGLAKDADLLRTAGLLAGRPIVGVVLVDGVAPQPRSPA